MTSIKTRVDPSILRTNRRNQKINVRKNSTTLHKAIILITSIIIAAASGLLLQYNTEGDQYHYREFYNFAATHEYLQVLLSSHLYIGSSEPVYPTIVWLASKAINKDVFIAVVNGFFAFTSLHLLHRFAVPLHIGLTVVLTNFYALVLYTGAERLKFALLFIVISALQTSKNSIKSGLSIAALSALTHIQVIAILLGELLHSVFKIENGRIKHRELIAIATGIFIVAGAAFVLQDYISMKATAYMDREKDPLGIIKLTALYILTMAASPQKLRITCHFAPLFILAPIVGAERLIIISYFIYLISYPGIKSIILKFIFYAILFYLSFKSIEYVTYIFNHGNGFAKE